MDFCYNLVSGDLHCCCQPWAAWRSLRDSGSAFLKPGPGLHSLAVLLKDKERPSEFLPCPRQGLKNSFRNLKSIL